jgi:hypothetical protein
MRHFQDDPNDPARAVKSPIATTPLRAFGNWPSIIHRRVGIDVTAGSSMEWGEMPPTVHDSS